jgi:hypothetical protein
MRHVMTKEEMARGKVAAAAARTFRAEAKVMRRDAELALLNRVLAEAAMPEWYPHQ